MPVTSAADLRPCCDCGRTRTGLVLASLCVAIGCGPSVVDGAAGSSGASGGSGTTGEARDDGWSTSSDGTTGAPFDASRWIGRYHFENVFLPFGERGDPLGTYALVNFEILPDGRATIFYDSCSFDEPVTRTYEWLPHEEHDWLVLQPGPGEPWLRFLGPDPVESLRVQLVEPCRQLWIEVDGWKNSWSPYHPGESCWVDKCTTPGIMQVDYCEGEEPPPCP